MNLRREKLFAVLISLALLECPHDGRGEEPQATATKLFPFHEGGKDGKWGYINRNGEVVVPPRFTYAKDFSDGLARFVDGTSRGFLDTQGKVAFMLEGELKDVYWVWRFSEGLAEFSKKDKCGFIDRKGKIMVPAEYDKSDSFSDGLAGVNIGAKPDNTPPRPTLKVGGKWGFIDKTGALAIPIQFEYVDRFSDGLALVRIGDKFVYIDKTGKTKITLEYEQDDPMRWIGSAAPFSEGLARINIMGHKDQFNGFIDQSGSFVIQPQFEWAGNFAEGLAPVGVNKRWGYMDKRGRIVIPPQFDDARAFAEGLAAVQKGKHWCFIDKTGKTLISGPFNDADRFSGGLARVHEGGRFDHYPDGPAQWSGGAWYYINSKGEKIRRCREDDVYGADGYGREVR